METQTKQLQTLLKFTYGLVPITAGADKFTNILTNWEQYLTPGIKQMLPFGEHTFMMMVGAVEIVAGIIVLIKPHLGAWIVSAWLVLIAFTLIFGGHYLDVAVRDIVMAIGAFVLAKLSAVTDRAIA